MPLPVSSLALTAAASSTFRGLPPWRLLAAAAARPAVVRSIIVSRSICAKAAVIVQHGHPHGTPQVDSFGQGMEICALFSDVRDDVQDMLGVTSQSVKLSHGEYVTGLQPVQSFGRPRSFGVDPLTPWSAKIRTAPADWRALSRKSSADLNRPSGPSTSVIDTARHQIV